jgi:hypothetical protein
MTVSRQIGETRVEAECEEALKSLAEDVLSTFERLAAQSPLRAGMRVRFGWSMLTLESSPPGGLIVCEPDFERDALRETRPVVNDSLEIAAKQTAFARAVGVTPLDVYFDQYVVLERDALVAHSIRLLRSQASSFDDSGWSISPAEHLEEPREEDLGAIRLYELLRRRRSIFPALILPTDLIVLVNGDRIASVLTPGDRDLLVEL